MLKKARERVKRRGWKNFNLVCADAVKIPLRDGSMDKVVCAYGITFIPDHRGALKESVRILKGGGRLSIVDAKFMSGMLGSILNPIVKTIIRACCTHPSTALKRKPWKEMEKFLKKVEVKEHYLGMVYMVSGVKAKGGEFG